jgi:hypothetical protein
MGLDAFEFIRATEVAFAVEIREADTVRGDTLRKLIAWLRWRSPAADGEALSFGC